MLPDGGLLSPRFLVVLLACLLTMLTKAILISAFTTSLITTTSCLAALILPGLITGVFFIWHSDALQTILSLILLHWIPQGWGVQALFLREVFYTQQVQQGG